MDMKRILQALDGVATKPVGGAGDMARFLRVVKEADLNQKTEWDDLVQDIQETGKTAEEAIAIITAWLKKNPTGTAEQATLQILPQFDQKIVPGQSFNPQQKNDGNSYLPGEREYAQQYAAKGNLASAEYLKNIDLSKSSYDPGTGIRVTVTPGTKESMHAESADILKLAGILTEANTSHKVALPVQMAMQHYSTPKQTPTQIKTESLLKGYLQELDEEAVEKQLHKRRLINQYAQTIAHRVMMKESRVKK